jgi:hypothetical protein
MQLLIQAKSDEHLGCANVILILSVDRKIILD